MRNRSEAKHSLVGLLYDENALDAAWDEVKGWSIAERQLLRDAVTVTVCPAGRWASTLSSMLGVGSTS